MNHKRTKIDCIFQVVIRTLEDFFDNDDGMLLSDYEKFLIPIQMLDEVITGQSNFAQQIDMLTDHDNIDNAVFIPEECLEEAKELVRDLRSQLKVYE
jgi:hypothetical protein